MTKGKIKALSERGIEMDNIIVSGVVAIVTAIVTVKLTYQNEAKRLLLEKRMELYFDFYNHVESVLNSIDNVTKHEYLDGLSKFKPRMKLLTSASTFEAFKKYYEYISKQVYEYEKFKSGNDPIFDDSRIEYISEEEEKAIFRISESDISKYDALVEQYLIDKLPKLEELNRDYIIPLYNAMRKDLHIE